MDQSRTPNRATSAALSPHELQHRRDSIRAAWLKQASSRGSSTDREALIAACLAAPLNGTADFYPARSFTMDDADGDLLLQIVDRKLSELIIIVDTKSSELIIESPPHEVLLAQLHDQLCGPEPLRVEELRRFLHAEAVAIQGRLEQLVAQQLRRRREGSVTGAGTREVRTASAITEDTMGGVIYQHLAFYMAVADPERTGTYLAVLRSLIESSSENGEVYLLHYFAAATIAEIAVLLGRPEVDVEDQLILANTHIASATQTAHNP